MIKQLFLFPAVVFVLNFAFSSPVQSALWPQKDIKEFQAGKSLSKHKILIIATSSAFKDSVIRAFVDSVTRGDSVFVNVVGMKKIVGQKVDNWSAVVIANTCMASQIDGSVKKIINENKNYKGFIVLTTSGNPKGCNAANKIKGIDAVSSASVESKRGAMVNALLELVRKKF